MALKNDGTTLRERLNVNQPTTVADKLCTTYFGAILRSLKTHLFGKTPAAHVSVLGTLLALKLSDFGKALTIVRAYSRTGAVVGELAVVPYGTTPATGQIAVSPSGDIVTLAADAITKLDVVYLPQKHDTTELVLPVAAGTVALPPSLIAAGVTDLFEAEATKGAGAGHKVILVPGAAVPGAGQARLNAAKTAIIFEGATVTEARVKLGFAPAYDLDAMLEATSDMY